MHSADCDTDHALIRCKVRFSKPRRPKTNTPQQRRTPKMETLNMKDPGLLEQFKAGLTAALGTPSADSTTSCEDKWSKLRDSLQRVGKDTFGPQSRKRPDWFQASLDKIGPVLDEKRNSRLTYINSPNPANKEAMKEARANAQRVLRKAQRDFWDNICEKVQRCDDRGDIAGVHAALKSVLGPSPRLTAPLQDSDGNILLEKTEQLRRWVDHYSTLYSNPVPFDDSVLDSIEQLPELTSLDSQPTLQEVERALKDMKSGKAPGSDGIPPELLKLDVPVLREHLLDLLVSCWREGRVPQDLKDAKLVTLFKNKGSRQVCDNYRAIALLSLVGKLFARVILMRLQVIADRVYPESQCGFRRHRSTIDMVFTLRLLQEKCIEQNKPFLAVFVDLTKAFDSVSREGLYLVLHKLGCPPKLLAIIKAFHDGMSARVDFDGDLSEAFTVKCGVKQGCVLAPTLFGIFISTLLHIAFPTPGGIAITTRSSGKLFNLARLKAKTKTSTVLIRELMFADDAAFCSHGETELQGMCDAFSNTCDSFGQVISVKKTVAFSTNAPPPQIKIKENLLATVEDFRYLGSTVSSSGNLNREVDSRIGQAANLFGKLKRRAWDNKYLTIHTKVRIYQTCVLSSLLYGSETWASHTHVERKLNSFHLRCLRKICGVSWMDKVSNLEILGRCGTTSLYPIIKQRRLRWLGHVSRMAHSRLPHQVLYGQLADGKRSRGRPKLRFVDVCRRDLRQFNISADWEKLAQDRASWRHTLHKGSKELENVLEKKEVERSRKRHEPCQSTEFCCETCGKPCRSRAGLVAHRRAHRR